VKIKKKTKRIPKTKRKPKVKSDFDNHDFSWDFYREMVRARVLEEQLIQLMRKGQGFFWTGGPGEEALNITLGKLLQKGIGPHFDYFHPHYRNTGVVLAMGAPMINSIRQMRNSETDPYTGGRNFVSHSVIPEWNVSPVTSPVGTQCLVGIGTALAQARARRDEGARTLSVSVIGDATSASPDFASALIWSSRPKQKLPLLIVVSDNGEGISTPTATQLAVIGKRAESFGIRCVKSDGIDAVKLWESLKGAFNYVRETGEPCVFEAKVSRLYGHSSSSGGNRVEGEPCPIEILEIFLRKQDFTDSDFKNCRHEALLEFQEAAKASEGEGYPPSESIYRHIFSED